MRGGGKHGRIRPSAGDPRSSKFECAEQEKMVRRATKQQRRIEEMFAVRTVAKRGRRSEREEAGSGERRM